MSKRGYARRSLLWGAVVAGLGLPSLAFGQAITFNPPPDAPNGGNGTFGVLEVTNNGGTGDQDAARRG